MEAPNLGNIVSVVKKHPVITALVLGAVIFLGYLAYKKGGSAPAAVAPSPVVSSGPFPSQGGGGSGFIPGYAPPPSSYVPPVNNLPPTTPAPVPPTKKPEPGKPVGNHPGQDPSKKHMPVDMPVKIRKVIKGNVPDHITQKSKEKDKKRDEARKDKHLAHIADLQKQKDADKAGKKKK